MRARRAAAALTVSLVGCTFAGLADYEVAECDPSAPLEQDACNQLNTTNNGCRRWQCSQETRRCVLGVLDEDKDGDPSIACGGKDCDDTNPRRSSRTPETCDGIDNDCDGVIDNGLLVPVSPVMSSVVLADLKIGGADPRFTSTSVGEAYATYLGQTTPCVHGFPLGEDPGDAGCVLVHTGDASVPDAAPPVVRHPELVPVGVQRDSTSGVVFVEEHPGTGCEKDQLAFSSQASRAAGHSSLGDCGAALPSLVSFPLQSTALIAFYDARVSERLDPVGGCTTTKPAPLKVRWVDGPTSDAPDLTTSAASILGDATSTRPPGLVALQGGTSVILASPFGASAGLWTLTPDGRVIPLATEIPALEDARAVAAAVGVDDGISRIAVVAERGCRPAQGITMVISVVDVLTGSLALPVQLEAVVVVPSPAAVATAPSVMWVEDRREWWVTWIDERSKAMLRRVAADGRGIDDAVEIGDAALATVRTGGQGAFEDAGMRRMPTAFVLRPDGSAVDQVSFACR